MASPRRPFPRRDPAGLERLRERVRALEGTGARLDGEPDGHAVAGFGLPAIDSHLPWRGLPRDALHEVIAGDAGAATGFCAALIGRLAGGSEDGPVLWCESRHALDSGGIYAPGLARFGLDPARLILVRARRDDEVLWAMEEGLRCRGLSAVVGEAREVSLTASRRLQLAAAEGRTMAILLRPRAQAASASAATTRWRVDAAPDCAGGEEPGLGPARWRAEMFRCRGGGPRSWNLEWRDGTGGFAVAAAVRDRPAEPRPSRLAG